MVVARGSTEARRVPTRSCVACRTVRAKRELDRIVRTPEGDVRLDPSGRLPGRGAYVCRDAACREKALARGGLARALGVTVPADLGAALEPAPDSMLTIEGGVIGQE
ncbi:MAG: RNase P modulator RnpM [Chloroflexota bacterium]